MASSDMRVRVTQVGLDRSMEESYNRGARRIARRPIRVRVDSRGFEQPLGRITGKMSEFQKSMDASVARVFAFGAAVSVINGVSTAFKSLVSETIAVEKALVDINVLLQLSGKNLSKFGSQLFSVAKNTAQGFDTISTAAAEFARQGLTAEQTLKRVNDAMVLTRLSGLDAAASVQTLTAAVNSFTNEALRSTDVINRLANVDAAFAVSSKDLADSIARSGAAAKSAGVQFNELLAITTAVQQRTARGGAVIGNAFKTIFTRLQRSGVREVLEGIGVSTTKLDGTFRNSATVLQDYANAYRGLTDQQKAYTAEQVAGVRQVNILKSLIGDMGNKYSTFSQALSTANRTTDQASRRNEQLNKTMAALATQTSLSVQEMAASLGKLTMGEGVQRVLSVVKSLSDGLNKLLDPQEGSSLIQGFFKGIGNFIAGPGLVLIGGAFLKIFKIVGKLGVDAGKSIFGLNRETERQQKLQQAILHVLNNEETAMQRLIAAQGNSVKQEQILLGIIKQETAERAKQQKFVSSLAALPALRGVSAGPQGFIVRGGAGKAGGHVPQRGGAAIQERAQAAEGGYKAGRVSSMTLPSSGKSIVYNMAEQVKFVPNFKDPFINPPQFSSAGQKHKSSAISKTGINPYAASGWVPNFALSAEELENRLKGWTTQLKGNIGTDGKPKLSLNQALKTPAGGNQSKMAGAYAKVLRGGTADMNSSVFKKAVLAGEIDKGTQAKFLSLFEKTAEPGRVLKNEIARREGLKTKNRSDKDIETIGIGKYKSGYISLGGGVDAPPGGLSTAFNNLNSSSRQALERRRGELINPRSSIQLKPGVDFISSIVSQEEFRDEIKGIVKPGARSFDVAKTASLAARLFPSGPGLLDENARGEMTKKIRTELTKFQKKDKTGRVPVAASKSASFVDRNSKKRGNFQATGEGWIFEKLSSLASQALSGAALKEMRADNNTWDLPAPVSAKFRDYYNTDVRFGDFKRSRRGSSISSFIGKHARKPSGQAGASGFIPNLATPALGFSDLLKKARARTRGIDASIQKSLRNGAITSDQASQLTAEAVGVRGGAAPSIIKRKDQQKAKVAKMAQVNAEKFVTMLVPGKQMLSPTSTTIKQGDEKVLVKFMMAGTGSPMPGDLTQDTAKRMRRQAGALAYQAFPGGRRSTPNALTGHAAPAAGVVWETAAKHAAQMGITESGDRWDVGPDPTSASKKNFNLLRMFQNFTSPWADMKLGVGQKAEMAHKVMGAVLTGTGPGKFLRSSMKNSAKGFVPNLSVKVAQTEAAIPPMMAEKVSEAVQAEVAAGVAPQDVRIGTDPRVRTPGNIVVYDANQGSASQAIDSHGGITKAMSDSKKGRRANDQRLSIPTSALYPTSKKLPRASSIDIGSKGGGSGIRGARGYVPNFAFDAEFSGPRSKIPGASGSFGNTNAAKQVNKFLNEQIKLYRKGALSQAGLNAQLQRLQQTTNLTTESFQKIQQQMREEIKVANKKIAADKKELRSNQNQARANRIMGPMMGASFMLPMATGMLPEGQGGTAGGMASGALQGLGSGAGIGALLAMSGSMPLMVAGGAIAIAGGIIGAAKKSEKSLAELSKELGEAEEKSVGLVNGLRSFITTQEQYNNAIMSGDEGVRAKVFENLTQAFGSIEDASLRAEILAAGDGLEDLTGILNRLTTAAEASSKANSAVLTIAKADEERTTLGTEDLGSKLQGGVVSALNFVLPKFLERGPVSEPEKVADWTEDLQKAAQDLASAKDLTLKEVAELRKIDPKNFIEALKGLGLTPEVATRTAGGIVGKTDQATMARIIQMAGDIQLGRAQDTEALTRAQAPNAAALAIVGTMRTAFEELGAVTERVIKNFAALSKAEGRLLQSSLNLQDAFGVGESSAGQRQQVFEFQRQNLETTGALELEEALRKGVGTLLEDNPDKAVVATFEKMLADMTDTLNRGDTFGAQNFSKQILTALKDVKGAADGEELSTIDQTLRDIQMNTDLQVGLLKSQLRVNKEIERAAQGQALQAKFGEDSLRDLSLMRGIGGGTMEGLFGGAGGIKTISSIKDSSDVFLRLQKKLEKIGVDLPEELVDKAEWGRLGGNLGEVLQALNLATTDTGGGGLSIGTFDANKQSMPELFEVKGIMKELTKDLSGKELINALGLDKLTPGSGAASPEIKTAFKTFIEKVTGGEKIGAGLEGILKKFFEAAVLRQRQAFIKDNNLSGQIRQVDGKSSLTAAKDLGQGEGPLGIFGQQGIEKLDEGNQLLENIERELQIIAGTFEARQKEKTIAEKSQAGVKRLKDMTAADTLKIDNARQVARDTFRKAPGVIEAGDANEVAKSLSKQFAIPVDEVEKLITAFGLSGNRLAQALEKRKGEFPTTGAEMFINKKDSDAAVAKQTALFNEIRQGKPSDAPIQNISQDKLFQFLRDAVISASQATVSGGIPDLSTVDQANLAAAQNLSKLIGELGLDENKLRETGAGGPGLAQLSTLILGEIDSKMKGNIVDALAKLAEANLKDALGGDLDRGQTLSLENITEGLKQAIKAGDTNKFTELTTVLRALSSNTANQSTLLRRLSLSQDKVNKASGFIPNFTNPLTDSYKREVTALSARGVPNAASHVAVGHLPELRTEGNKAALGVYNDIDEPRGLRQGYNRARKEGINPTRYGGRARGHVPNFAGDYGFPTFLADFSSDTRNLYESNPSEREIQRILNNPDMSKPQKVGAIKHLNLPSKREEGLLTLLSDQAVDEPYPQWLVNSAFVGGGAGLAYVAYKTTKPLIDMAKGNTSIFNKLRNDPAKFRAYIDPPQGAKAGTYAMGTKETPKPMTAPEMRGLLDPKRADKGRIPMQDAYSPRATKTNIAMIDFFAAEDRLGGKPMPKGVKKLQQALVDGLTKTSLTKRLLQKAGLAFRAGVPALGTVAGGALLTEEAQARDPRGVLTGIGMLPIGVSNAADALNGLWYLGEAGVNQRERNQSQKRYKEGLSNASLADLQAWARDRLAYDTEIGAVTETTDPNSLFAHRLEQIKYSEKNPNAKFGLSYKLTELGDPNDPDRRRFPLAGAVLGGVRPVKSDEELMKGLDVKSDFRHRWATKPRSKLPLGLQMEQDREREAASIRPYWGKASGFIPNFQKSVGDFFGQSKADSYDKMEADTGLKGSTLKRYAEWKRFYKVPRGTGLNDAQLGELDKMSEEAQADFLQKKYRELRKKGKVRTGIDGADLGNRLIASGFIPNFATFVDARDAGKYSFPAGAGHVRNFGSQKEKDDWLSLHRGDMGPSYRRPDPRPLDEETLKRFNSSGSRFAKPDLPLSAKSSVYAGYKGGRARAVGVDETKVVYDDIVAGTFSNIKTGGGFQNKILTQDKSGGSKAMSWGDITRGEAQQNSKNFGLPVTNRRLEHISKEDPAMYDELRAAAAAWKSDPAQRGVKERLNKVRNQVYLKLQKDFNTKTHQMPKPEAASSKVNIDWSEPRGMPGWWSNKKGGETTYEHADRLKIAREKFLRSKSSGFIPNFDSGLDWLPGFPQEGDSLRSGQYKTEPDLPATNFGDFGGELLMKMSRDHWREHLLKTTVHDGPGHIDNVIKRMRQKHSQAISSIERPRDPVKRAEAVRRREELLRKAVYEELAPNRLAHSLGTGWDGVREYRKTVGPGKGAETVAEQMLAARKSDGKRTVPRPSPDRRFLEIKRDLDRIGYPLNDRPALKEAYYKDPDGFLKTWRKTGGATKNFFSGVQEGAGSLHSKIFNFLNGKEEAMKVSGAGIEYRGQRGIGSLGGNRGSGFIPNFQSPSPLYAIKEGLKHPQWGKIGKARIIGSPFGIQVGEKNLKSIQATMGDHYKSRKQTNMEEVVNDALLKSSIIEGKDGALLLKQQYSDDQARKGKGEARQETTDVGSALKEAAFNAASQGLSTRNYLIDKANRELTGGLKDKALDEYYNPAAAMTRENSAADSFREEKKVEFESVRARMLLRYLDLVPQDEEVLRQQQRYWLEAGELAPGSPLRPSHLGGGDVIARGFIPNFVSNKSDEEENKAFRESWAAGRESRQDKISARKQKENSRLWRMYEKYWTSAQSLGYLPDNLSEKSFADLLVNDPRSAQKFMNAHESGFYRKKYDQEQFDKKMEEEVQKEIIKMKDWEGSLMKAGGEYQEKQRAKDMEAHIKAAREAEKKRVAIAKASHDPFSEMNPLSIDSGYRLKSEDGIIGSPLSALGANYENQAVQTDRYGNKYLDHYALQDWAEAQRRQQQYFEDKKAMRGVPPLPPSVDPFGGISKGFIPNFASGMQEVMNARSRGATPNVKAQLGRGTIGGKRFIMNNEETEYLPKEMMGLGLPRPKGNDSMVVRHYGDNTQRKELQQKVTKANKSDGFVPNFVAPPSMLNTGDLKESSNIFSQSISAFSESVSQLSKGLTSTINTQLAITGIDVPSIVEAIKTALGPVIAQEISVQLKASSLSNPFAIKPPSTSL